MSRYRLSRSAQRDLTEITSYISQHSPAAAVDFLDLLITRFEQIAAQPLLGRTLMTLAPGRCVLRLGCSAAAFRRLLNELRSPAPQAVSAQHDGEGGCKIGETQGLAVNEKRKSPLI